MCPVTPDVSHGWLTLRSDSKNLCGHLQMSLCEFFEAPNGLSVAVGHNLLPADLSE